MNFKSIFWLFNIVIFVSLVLFAIISFSLLGKEYAATFWSDMWIFLVPFGVLIGILDFYFLYNRRLFGLLEKEDWPALLACLESKIYDKGKLRRTYINLFINTALSLSNFDAIKRLEIKIRQQHSKMRRIFGVALGIPILLEQNSTNIVEYFGPLADNPQTLRQDWARWCRACHSGDDGQNELFELLTSKDISVQLLSFEFLSQHRDGFSPQQIQKIETIEKQLRTKLTSNAGKRMLQKSREEHLMATVLFPRVNKVKEELTKVT